MQSTKSEEDLRKVMEELGVMYDDLNTLQRQNKGKGRITGAYNEAYDEDYDIPRPASVFYNETPRPISSPSSQLTSPPAINLESDRNSQFNHSTQFTASPTVSAYSSGFGTLPSNRVLTPEFSFPGPPDFEPSVPPFPAPHSDSDYDEVVSIASDEQLYSKPNKMNKRKISKGSHASSDYAEVDDETTGHADVKDIDQLDDGIPDYDDVVSNASDNQIYSKPNKTDKRKFPNSSQGFSDYAEDHDDFSETTGPVDENSDEFDDGISDYDDVYSVPSSSRPISLVSAGDRKAHAVTPMVVEMKHVSHKLDQEQGERQMTAAETSFMNSQLGEDGGRATKTDSTREESERVPASNRNKTTVNTRSSGLSEQNSSQLNSKYSNRRRNMDLESQKKERKDCPCECGAAVPLMTFAVIICIIALMMIVIAFVYFGIKNDAYLESLERDNNNLAPGPPVGSGDGA